MHQFTFPKVLGADGFFWFFGVVEDNNDPDKLGRLKIRILGLHSEELVPNDATGKGIPLDDLPWAWTMKPMGSSSMDGLGWSALNTQKGTWVFGFSRDGDAYNDLVIMGSVGGTPEKGPDASKGFSDPDEKYPEILDEPDINRLARSEKLQETIVFDKTIARKVIVPQLPMPWWEPVTPYKAEYPFNEVFESKSGHIFEIDDTPGNERLHKYHKSGTYEEIDKDGTVVTKIVKDNYTIILGDNYVNVEGTTKICCENNADITLLGSINNIISTGAVNVTSSTIALTASRIDLLGSVYVNNKLIV